MTRLPSSEGRPDRATVLAFIGVVLFGAVNAIAVRQAVIELAPFWAAATRFLAAGLIMAAVVVVTRRSFPSGRSLGGAVLYGAVGFTGSYALIYQALKETTAGTTMVIIALAPLMTFGLAIAQRQERFRAQGLLGALVALVGIGVVFADQISADVPIFSLLLVVLGTACIAESGVVAKAIPKSDPVGTNAVAMLTGGGLLLALSILAGEPRAIPSQADTWVAAGYLVVFGSVVMFALYLFALGRWTASAVSYVTLLMPLVTVPLASILIGERITVSLLIGGGIVLVGVYLGAFANVHRAQVPTSSLPECLPAADGQAAEAVGSTARPA
jgi:drug/metabolite transporter (DMT)-like permease